MAPTPNHLNMVVCFFGWLVVCLRNCPLRRLGFISDNIFNPEAIEEAGLRNMFLKSVHKANKNFTIQTTFCLNSSSQTVCWGTRQVTWGTCRCERHPCFLHFLTHSDISWSWVRRKLTWEDNFKGWKPQQKSMEATSLWCCPDRGKDLKEATWEILVGGQDFQCSGEALLLMREDSGALYVTEMGLLSGASSVQALAGQPDRLVTPPAQQCHTPLWAAAY